MFNEQGRVLLVTLSYKSTWEIPGGVVEENESPKQCCQREVLEELGMDRIVGRLLVVDYNVPTDTKTESLMFIFNGGVLSRQDIDNIQIDQDELVGFAFFSQDVLPKEITNTLRRRILAAWKTMAGEGGEYLEGQE